mmetsp:Transcript_4371/g.6588  ORF Transcript_4371/g.6588 Transcript_4371/m.6588 type:complete len:231 (-) Transcript_4371:617-1309(-)
MISWSSSEASCFFSSMSDLILSSSLVLREMWSSRSLVFSSVMVTFSVSLTISSSRALMAFLSSSACFLEASMSLPRLWMFCWADSLWEFESRMKKLSCLFSFFLVLISRLTCWFCWRSSRILFSMFWSFWVCSSRLASKSELSSFWLFSSASSFLVVSRELSISWVSSSTSSSSSWISLYLLPRSSSAPTLSSSLESTSLWSSWRFFLACSSSPWSLLILRSSRSLLFLL